MAWGPPCRLPAAWVPGEGGFRGGSLSGGRALHSLVSSPGAGPLVSSRPAWWLAAGHPCLHAEKDG